MVGFWEKRLRRPGLHDDRRVRPGHPQRQHADRRAGRRVRPLPAAPDPRAGSAAAASARTPTSSTRRSKPLTETAHDRLATIAQNTDLGAGMAVAMKDLEIRGAGNLLGGEQSGHIADVGFDLYVRLVGEAVAEFKGREAAEDERPRSRSTCRSTRTCRTTTSPASGCGWRPTASSPRRARRARSTPSAPSSSTATAPLPEPVENLLAVAAFRVKARAAGLTEVSLQGKNVRFAPIELPERRSCGCSGSTRARRTSRDDHGDRAAADDRPDRRSAARATPSCSTGAPTSGDRDAGGSGACAAAARGRCTERRPASRAGHARCGGAMQRTARAARIAGTARAPPPSRARRSSWCVAVRLRVRAGARPGAAAVVGDEGITSTGLQVDTRGLADPRPPTRSAPTGGASSRGARRHHRRRSYSRGEIVADVTIGEASRRRAVRRADWRRTELAYAGWRSPASPGGRSALVRHRAARDDRRRARRGPSTSRAAAQQGVYQQNLARVRPRQLRATSSRRRGRPTADPEVRSTALRAERRVLHRALNRTSGRRSRPARPGQFVRSSRTRSFVASRTTSP